MAKYVMFDSPLHGEIPIIFPECINHAEIAHSIVHRYPGWKIVSAGFVSLQEDEPLKVFGKSKTLEKLSEKHISRKIDDLIIETALKHY